MRSHVARRGILENRRGLHAAAWCTLCAISTATGVRADEPLPAGDPAKPAVTAEQPGNDEPTDALPGVTLGDLTDPVSRIIEGMKQVQERITRFDTGTETRAAQQQVVTDIDKLIELAKAQAKSGSGKSQQPQSKPDEGQSPKGEKQQNASRDPRGSNGSTGKRRDQPAEESSDTARAGDATREQLLSPRDLVNDVWGHLPPAIREELLNVSTEKVVQKYEGLLRRYYESLAEQEQPDSPNP